MAWKGTRAKAQQLKRKEKGEKTKNKIKTQNQKHKTPNLYFFEFKCTREIL